MSSTTNALTRSARGIPLPDIDTRGPISKPATALSLGGWLTPPQSAHESRRGSLAHSCYSDAPFSGASSVSAFSAPATPVHLTGQVTDPFAQQWSHHTANPLTSHLARPYSSNDQLQDDLLHAPIQQSACVPDALNIVQMYPAPGQVDSHVSFGMPIDSGASFQDPWSDHGHATQMANDHDAGLRPSLFQPQQEMPIANISGFPSFHDMGGMAQTTTVNTPSAGLHQAFEPASASFCQQPQVVVPSQLSPVDGWTLHQYSGYHSPEHSGAFANSFSSTRTNLSSYGSITPPTPEDEYLFHSEDDGYMMVKEEHLASPTPGFSLLKCRPSGITKTVSSRSRRRTSKRGKSNVPETLLDNWDCEVTLKGKWHFDDRGHPTVETPVSASKPHKCREMLPNGKECEAKFERSEHLKRHQRSHSDEREYPCPLPRCERAISRSDNATDHFKTHLKGPRKGQRNQHFEWPTLKHLLEEAYSDKEALKMITKLEKHCREDHELLGQRHWVLPEDEY